MKGKKALFLVSYASNVALILFMSLLTYFRDNFLEDCELF